MIWMFSFARSGSTLLQDLLCNAFGYTKVFEPFGFKPERCSDSETVTFIQDYFRGAPDPSELSRYRVGDYYIGHVPPGSVESVEIKPYRERLKAYLSEIYAKYGDRVVVKCIRQLGNIPFIDSVLREISVAPRYILLIRDPFEIAYSYYRMGGLCKESSWRVPQLFEYRKKMYPCEDAFLDTLFDRARNNVDKLICSILADYRAFDWAEREVKCLKLRYEKFMRRPAAELERIQTFAGLEAGSVSTHAVESRRLSLSRLDLSVSDPLFSLLAWGTNKRLFYDHSDHCYPIAIRRWRPRPSQVRFWLRYVGGFSPGG